MNDEDNRLSNYDDIVRTLRLFLPPKAVIELRALGSLRKGTIAGYFESQYRDLMADECRDLAGTVEGVYATVNPVLPDLLARANNHTREWARNTTKDVEVVRRRWLPLDFDPVRPSGISATDAEHDAALALADEARSWLRQIGFSARALVLADSGNGAHLLVRANLPNDPAATELVRKGIEAVAHRFSTEKVKVDLTTFNAARLMKVYGTLAAKGDSIPTRPHRLARLIRLPKKCLAAERHQLEKLAGLAPVKQARLPAVAPRGQSAGIDAGEWLEANNVAVATEKSLDEGGRLWVLAHCPWVPAHRNHSAFVMQFSSGAIVAKCHHDSCAGRTWSDLRDVVEPNWRRAAADQLANLPPAIAREMRLALSKKTKTRS